MVVLFNKTNWSDLIMSIIFSRQCEYALQAASYLALQPQGKLVSIKELTERLKIPYHYLGKILQELAQERILISQKGRNGGFALAADPEKTTLYKIIEAIDGTEFTHRCAMGFSECSSKSPCAVHDQWEKSRTEIVALLSDNNILTMAKAMKRPEYHISPE
jgi:Rrf2 family transcriptional regulator, iron-sulfur cluster assembly transcription factor